MELYSLSIDELKILGPEKSVDFVRKLLWYEALKIGISPHLIDIPSSIFTGDGGIDAHVENPGSTSDDFIPLGITGFQIKSSDLAPADCKKELHMEGNLDKPLKPAVKDLMDKNGTYILTLFVDMPRDTMKRARKNAIVDELKRCGYSRPKVEIYTINQMVNIANKFISLVIEFKGSAIECVHYDGWAKERNLHKPYEYIFDEERDNIIKDMREVLINSKETPVFRITGLPGIGKTRLVFEALSKEDIKNRVIYIDADVFKNSSLYNFLLINDNLSVIIVADECSLSTHNHIMNRFSDVGSRIALITISHEISSDPPNTLSYKLNRLDKEHIIEILEKEARGLPKEIIDRISSFADGFPRIAILLAENYKVCLASGEDFLRLTDEDLINRLIAGTANVHTSEFQKTKKVLTYIALFRKVGYKSEVAGESEWLADVCGLNLDEFKRIVNEQKKRGIIQGQHYIYVTPMILAIQLIQEWYTYNDNIEGFLSSIPEDYRMDMADRFISLIPYAKATEQGKELIKQILSDGGIYVDGELLKTEFGSKFFLKLTEANPSAALRCLENTVGTWSKEELINFVTGRREIVWALERIVIWRKLFARAAMLLSKLGEAENEPYANNASGIFINLFSPAPGETSYTEAPLKERFPILVQTFNSNSIDLKLLSLKGFNSALRIDGFHRVAGAEYQGGKPLPQFWNPKTYAEIYDYYKKVWTYLENHLNELVDEITRKEAINVLLRNARPIAIHTNEELSRIVISTLRRISSLSWVDKKELIETVSDVTFFDSAKMPKDLFQEWSSLKEELIGEGFANELKRFVELNLHEDYFLEGKYGESHANSELFNSKIRELANMALNDPNLLEPEYSWLMTSKAQNGVNFGYELGKLDNNNYFLDKILKKQKNIGINGNISFLGGYLRALSQKDKELVENILIFLSEDDFFRKYIPELSWRSVITDKIAEIILSMTKKDIIKLNSFEIFTYGSSIRNISENTLNEWINYLLNETSGKGAFIALNLLYSYYRDSNVIPIDLTLDVLLNPILLDIPENLSVDQMSEYYWKEIALKLINQDPKTMGLIAENMIKSFGSERSIFIRIDPKEYELLLEIIKKDPKLVWKHIIKYIGPPLDDLAFFLRSWLRSEDDFVKDRHGALEFFDPEDIWKWVEEDIDNRAWYLATFVPPHLYHSEKEICLARELLVRYGDREDVRRNFMANYSTGGWVGSQVDHYKNMKNDILEFKKDENDENIIKWITEYLKSLDNDIKRATIQEEKERR